MKVIKVVNKEDGKLISTFAESEWQKEYAEGIETKPDAGCLFAFSRRNMREARLSMGNCPSLQYWLAEAKVVGRMYGSDIIVTRNTWHAFWKEFKLRLRLRGTEYLLCSSITLVKRLA